MLEIDIPGVTVCIFQHAKHIDYDLDHTHTKEVHQKDVPTEEAHQG